MARLNIQRRRKKSNSGFVFLMIILLLVSFFAGFFVGKNSGKGKTDGKEKEGKKSEQKQEQSNPNQATDAEAAVDKLMSEMTLSDKVYQMMFVTPESITKVGAVVQAGETTKNAIAAYPVGGLVYFAKNFESREQTVTMLQNTQSYSKIPLFISVDEEGGRVSRLGSNQAMGVTKQPPMKEIGDTKDAQKAYAIGQTLGEELTALGFNTDFAPIADVLLHANNTEIGDRSFGSNPEEVAVMVENIVKGMEEKGLSATLKHFPGHGSTQTDSHTGYSESQRTLDELRSFEFLPFISGFNAGADMVMISHMTLVNATEEKVPCSVSKEVITDLLKTELGFQGVILTDSFQMKAITDQYTSAQAAVKAIEAGVDMILMPQDLEAAHKGIVDAVNAGTISQERIDESVKKILMLKFEKGMLN